VNPCQIHPFAAVTSATPQALYDLTANLFDLVQRRRFTVHGAARGRLFEGLLYRNANARRLPLFEKAGLWKVRSVRAASGFGHDSDAVLAFPAFTVHCEPKHLSSESSKHELLIFNQKRRTTRLPNPACIAASPSIE
jgi:hypothetical protein